MVSNRTKIGNLQDRFETSLKVVSGVGRLVAAFAFFASIVGSGNVSSLLGGGSMEFNFGGLVSFDTIAAIFWFYLAPALVEGIYFMLVLLPFCIASGLGFKEAWEVAIGSDDQPGHDATSGEVRGGGRGNFRSTFRVGSLGKSGRHRKHP